MIFHKMMLISLLLLVMSLSVGEIFPIHWVKTRRFFTTMIPMSIVSSILFFVLYLLERN